MLGLLVCFIQKQKRMPRNTRKVTRFRHHDKIQKSVETTPVLRIKHVFSMSIRQGPEIYVQLQLNHNLSSQIEKWTPKFRIKNSKCSGTITIHSLLIDSQSLNCVLKRMTVLQSFRQESCTINFIISTLDSTDNLSALYLCDPTQ